MKTWFRPLLATLLLLTGLSGPLFAQTSTTYYLYSLTPDELPGSTENSVYKPKKAAEVLSFQLNGANSVTFGTTSNNTTTGTVAYDGVRIVFDSQLSVLPALLQKNATGTKFDDLVLECVANNIVRFKIELKMAFIETIEVAGTQGDRAIFNAVIKFGAIRMTTYNIKPDGTQDPNGLEFSRSVIKNNNTFTVQ